MKHKIFGSLSSVLLIKMVQMLLQLVVGMLLARYLEPFGYGLINYVASYIAFASTIVGLGLNGIIIKEFIDNPCHDNVILGTAIFIRLLAGLVSAVSIICIIMFLNPNNKEILYIALLESVALFFMAFDSINYWYQAHHHLQKSAVIQLIGYAITSLYKVILIIVKAPILWFAFATSLDVIFVGFLLYFMYRQDGGMALHFDKKMVVQLLKKAAPFLVANIMIVVYQQIDKVMLGKMFNITQVGYYSAVTTISNMFGVISVTLLDIFRPIIMEQKNGSIYEKRLIQLFFSLIYLNVVISIVISIGAEWLIRILFGEDYCCAAGALRIVIWYTCFSYVGSGRSIYLICEGKSKYAQVFCLWGIVIDIVLNLILIPYYGIEGAATATLITHIFSDFIIPGIYKETRSYCKYVLKGMLAFNLFWCEIKAFIIGKKCPPKCL